MHQEKIINLHSRAHTLNTLQGWIKREDELSFGVSGNKLRKLLPLVDHLVSLGKPHVAAIGSAYSNFILGLAQHLNEHQIEYTLYLRKPHHWVQDGNFAYLMMLVKPENIVWFERGEEPKVDPSSFFIPEGGFGLEALKGAITLATSIAQNEEDLGIKFERIIIDAGSGLGAIGLIIGTAILNKKWSIEVFNMCDSKEQFCQKLHDMHHIWNQSLCLPFFECHELQMAKAYGSMNSTLRQYIEEFAREEGIFLDPLYSSKLFYHLKTTHHHLMTPKTLVIHSGGALSLKGFVKKTL